MQSHNHVIHLQVAVDSKVHEYRTHCSGSIVFAIQPRKCPAPGYFRITYLPKIQCLEREKEY